MKKLVALVVSLSFILTLFIPCFTVFGSDKEVFTEDFEYASNEEAKAAIESYSYFELGSYLGKDGFLKKEGDNTYLRMVWSEGRLLRALPNSQLALRGNYTFTVDVRATGTNHDGGWVFLRTHTRAFLTHDKKWINEYETDSYKDEKYNNGVGATGVYVKPHGTKIQIGIRTTEPVSTTHPAGLGRKYVEIDAPNGKNVGTTFFKLKVEDNNNVMKIYADDVLLVTIEYSQTNGFEYTKAVMKGADGNVLLDVNNARIAHHDAAVAFCNRGGTIDIDNIRLEKEVPAGHRRKLHPGDKSVAVQVTTNLAVQFTATEKFDELVLAAPNYSDDIGNLTLSLYKWNQSYAKTLEQNPIASIEYVNFPDSNPGLSISFPAQDAGQYLLYVENTSEDPEEKVGVWAASATENVKTYVNGVVKNDLAAQVSIVYLNAPETDYGEISTVFSISIDQNITNGTISVQETAYDGETVKVTVNPAAGMKLKTIKVNGEAISGTEFVMPKGNVTVSAEFEEVQNPPTGDMSILPVLFVTLIALAYVLKKKAFA